MFVASIVCLITCIAQDEKIAVDSKTYLDYMKIAYRSNRALFTFGFCEFGFVTGTASSADDARAGRFSQALTARGVYAYDGKNIRYERLYDEQDLIKNTTRTGNQLRSTANSFRVLSDGQFCMFDHISAKMSLDGIDHTAQIDPGIKHLYRDFLFPIDLWHPHPVGLDLASDIDSVQKGDYTLTELDPKTSFEGHEVVHFSFRTEEFRRSYWVDLKRGAVPLQIIHEVRPTHRAFQLNHDDLRPSKGSGWIPRQVTLYVESHKLVRQVNIREIKLDRPPDPSTFRMEFPKPISMVDTARNLIYPPQKSWSLTSLPPPNSGRAKRIEGAEYKPPPPTMPGERTAWSPRSVILVVAGVVLLIITLILISVAIKRRR